MLASFTVNLRIYVASSPWKTIIKGKSLRSREELLLCQAALKLRDVKESSGGSLVTISNSRDAVAKLRFCSDSGRLRGAGLDLGGEGGCWARPGAQPVSATWGDIIKDVWVTFVGTSLKICGSAEVCVGPVRFWTVVTRTECLTTFSVRPSVRPSKPGIPLKLVRGIDWSATCPQQRVEKWKRQAGIFPPRETSVGMLCSKPQRKNLMFLSVWWMTIAELLWKQRCLAIRGTSLEYWLLKGLRAEIKLNVPGSSCTCLEL